MLSKKSNAELVNYYVYYVDVIQPAIQSNPTNYQENSFVLNQVVPVLEELTRRDISEFLKVKVSEALTLCKEY